MKKTKIIIGNWKMNKTIQETESFMTTFNKMYKALPETLTSLIKVGFAVPSIVLHKALALADKKINFGVQNIYPAPFGSFTGETSGAMAFSAGASFVLVGHSERRLKFNETDELVHEKLKSVLNNHMTAVLCVGENLNEHKEHRTEKVVAQELKKALGNIKDVTKIMVAYEPVWAIGANRTPTFTAADKVCAYIRKVLNNKNITVLYGGSVTPLNIHNFLRQPNIDGVLVGGASLRPATMIELLKNAVSLDE